MARGPGGGGSTITTKEKTLTLMHRLIAFVLAGAALALAGCGGSSHSSSASTQSVAQVATATSSASATTTTTTSTTKSDPQATVKKAGHHSASHRSTTHVTHHSPHREPATHHTSHTTTVSVPRSKPGKVIGPSPLVCLRQRGLVHAKALGPDRWWARDLATLKPVYVDGPFKTVAEAKADVASLQGVEYAERGGLYVVNAALDAHINNDVHFVAACLSTTSGRGSLTF
jgi:hypothetical protein